MLLDAVIAQAEERLDALKAKPSSFAAIRTFLVDLDAKIWEAQERGCSHAEVVNVVLECVPGVDADELRKELLNAVDPTRRKHASKRTKKLREKHPA